MNESSPFLFIFTDTWYYSTFFFFTNLKGETLCIIEFKSALSYLLMRLRLNMFSFNLWILYGSPSTKYLFIDFAHFFRFFVCLFSVGRGWLSPVGDIFFWIMIFVCYMCSTYFSQMMVCIFVFICLYM